MRTVSAGRVHDHGDADEAAIRQIVAPAGSNRRANPLRWAIGLAVALLVGIEIRRAEARIG
jgi:hypothetical protein